jgi:hypothetical protein
MLQAYGVNRGAETRLIPFPSSGQAQCRKGKLILNILKVRVIQVLNAVFITLRSCILVVISKFWPS